jgi:hypothetical protein
MGKATTFDAITKYAGQFDKQLVAQALNGMDFMKQVRVLRRASAHGVLLPKMTVNKGIRPLNLNVDSPKGTNRNFSGRKLYIHEGMKIITINPEEARGTFLDANLDPNAKEIPFAQWIWEQEMAKIASEINDNIYLSDYHGDAADYSAVTVYNPGDYITFTDYSVYKCVTLTTAGQSPTTHPAKWSEVDDVVISAGWGTIIADEITAGNIAGANLITTGAITNANALTKLELMFNSMTATHQRLGGKALVSSDVFRAYVEHERATYTAAATPELGDGKKYIYGTGKKWVIEESSMMGASGRVIMTQADNLAFGTNMEGDFNKIGKIVDTLHGYKAIVKWQQGCEISDLETLYVNEQV